MERRSSYERYEEEQKTFHEFCAHTGWKLACTSAQLQIFYNEKENPIPIETEPMLEIQSIHASAKKSFILSYILLLIVSFMNGGLFISSMLSDPIEQLASPTKLFTGFCFLVLFIICIMELGCYFYWYRKAKKMAEQGEFLKPISTAKFQNAILIVIIVGAIYWGIDFIFAGDKLRRWVGIVMCIYMPLLIFAVNATKNGLKKRKVSKGVNLAITLLVDFFLAFLLMGLIVFGTLKLSNHGFFAEEQEETYEHGGMTWEVHQDELPLTVEDLMETEYAEYIKARQGEESLFLADFELEQYPRFGAENYEEIPQLRYRIVDVKLPFLYDICKDRMIYEQEDRYGDETRKYKEQDAAPWGANEVYCLYELDRDYLNTYLLYYDSQLVEIRFTWKPTEEQKAVVAERFGD